VWPWVHGSLLVNLRALGNSAQFPLKCLENSHGMPGLDCFVDPRIANVVSFCPFDDDMLVAGFEKARNDPGLVCYNVAQILVRS
jgi:hypothetical protein